MNEFFNKLKKGKNKVDQFKEENREFRKRSPLFVMLLNDLLPLLVAVAYVLLGVFGGWWHPAWLVFLLVPIYYLTVESIKHKSAAAFPIFFVVTAVYLSLGCIGGLWHPYWAIFVAVPVYYMILAAIKGGSWAKVFDLLVPALAVAGFLLIGFLAGAWHPGWVIFFAVPLYYETKRTVRRYRYQKAAQENSADVSDVFESIDRKDDEEE